MSRVAKSHPKHYLMHKYWGRKPHNIVSYYINKFSKEGDTVLDPFLGSGGVVIESNKLNRNSIGVDLNPMSKFITENTLSLIDLNELKIEYKKIIESIPQEIKGLYDTKIDSKKYIITNSVWNEEEIIKIKAIREKDKIIKEPSEEDRRLIDVSSKLLKKYEENSNLFYPKDEMLKYVKRSGKTHINQLFSDRNILILAVLFNEIQKIKKRDIRKIFQMIFTSTLPNVSKMIPGDKNKVTGKSGWQITKFWVPKIHTEKNVFESFELRFKKILNAKEEIMPLLSGSDYKLFTKSSENLHFIESHSIDYIFTDPPYGESVAYFGLSMFWNSWIFKDVDYENEIIYDTFRQKDYKDYSDRLKNVFKECYRLLKVNKYLSFTFNNRKMIFWKIIIDACLNAGFSLTKVEWQEQAVSSGTQGINRKNTLKGDFIYTFLKDENNNKNYEDKCGVEEILKEAKKIFKKQSFVHASHIYEVLIPFIVNNRYFIDENNELIDLEKIISRNYKYGPMIVNDGIAYGWYK